MVTFLEKKVVGVWGGGDLTPPFSKTEDMPSFFNFFFIEERTTSGRTLVFQ